MNTNNEQQSTREPWVDLVDVIKMMLNKLERRGVDPAPVIQRVVDDLCPEIMQRVAGEFYREQARQRRREERERRRRQQYPPELGDPDRRRA